MTGALALLLSLFSCSTKKNTFTRRLYHNITARYNVYFNGKESLNEGTIELLAGSKDNFNKVLPVYNFGTKQEAQQLNPQMDKAIQKASIAIQKHSMPFDGTEKVKWIDDSYLMMERLIFTSRSISVHAALSTSSYRNMAIMRLNTGQWSGWRSRIIRPGSLKRPNHC